MESSIKTRDNTTGAPQTQRWLKRLSTWTIANRSDRKIFGRFFHAMLDEGVYLVPSQFEAGFVSIAHNDELIDATITAARKAFETIRGIHGARASCPQ